MVLHTIIDAYDIFYQGVTDQVQPPVESRGNAYFSGSYEPEGFRIGRVISTDLQDYLRFTPGAVLPGAKKGK